MTPAAFIAIVAPIAVKLRLDGYPIFPSVRVAQAGHETGWKIPAWNNLGGFKVGNGRTNEFWRGKVVNKGTWEVYDGKRVNMTAAFRAYDSIEDFFGDQDLLFQNSRYARVRTAATPEEQADMLQACGYATDPQYAQKLQNVILAYKLKTYDQEVLIMRELQKQVAELAARVEKLEAKVPAPAWFVKEFGSGDLGGVIYDPKFTAEGWRVLAIALRMRK